MQKHAALTLGRIRNTLVIRINDRIIQDRLGVEVEFCPEPHSAEAVARKSKNWQRVEPGFRWGEAYKVSWFRVKGLIPKEWAGAEVALIPELGGERTVWINNSPERGVDGPHAQYRLTDDAKGGEKFEYYIQSHAGNPSVRVHGGYTPPRVSPTETFKSCELVKIDSALQQLAYDVEFGMSLLSVFRETDPAYATLLRALNQVCNLLDTDRPNSISASRKVIKDALGSIPGEMKHTIIPCGHAHLDTAWLWPLEITHLKMAHTTANQLYLIDRYPRYVFVHSQASQYEWLEKEYPELLEKVKKAAAQGQWEVVGSMWVEADCNVTGSESLIRQFLYGRRYFQKHFGTPCEDMWLPDVFGYSAALPQILNQFGIRYFLTQKISWNQFNKFPHNTFWWQGIDGSRIWSHFPPADTYVGNGTPQEIAESVFKHKDQARSDHSLYLFGHGDGGGGPTELHLELLERARTAPGLPNIEMGRKALDFYREAKAKSKDLLTWSGELYLEMHRGTYTSQAKNKKFNRQCEFLLRDAEWLASFAPGKAKAYPAAELETAWKLVLLNQFHDIIPGSSVREVYDDSDRDYAKVFEMGERIVAEQLDHLAAQLDTSGCERPYGVFTASNLSSEGRIALDPDQNPGSMVCGGRSYPVQVVDAFGERQAIFEVPEDALGSVAVVDLRSEPHSGRSRIRTRDRRIENDAWSVKFDSHGNITSITSIDDRGTDFVAPGKLANVFQIFDDLPNFWGAWDIDLFAYETGEDLIRSESFEIVERGPVRAAVEVVKSFGKSRIRQRISLGPTPGIRFDTEIDWQEDHKLLKVAFPLNVNAQKATYEIQFGHVERPNHYNTSWDMARFEVPAQKWADLSQGDLGAALINDSKYGYDCNGNVLRLSLLRSPKAPDPDCDMGIHRFSYVLLPHFDHLVNSDIVAAGYAVNCPLRSVLLPQRAGVQGKLPKFVSVDSRNLIIETVKKAEDSEKTIVRLYECHNTRGKAWLQCVLPVRSAWLVDLNENPIAELEPIDGQLEIEFGPFEIVTLAIEF